MGAKTGIEWTDATWPIVQGCDYESPGCTNCYAVPLIWRLAHNPNPKISGPLRGLVEERKGKLVWTGKVALREDRLEAPLTWVQARKIFVPSHGDIFHDSVPDAFLDKIFAVMMICPHHTFQVLTKRPQRMRDYIRSNTARDCALRAGGPWPLPNVWLGTSVEDQARAESRRQPMAELAAEGWLTWVSYEPALERVEWKGWEFLKWMVIGGESGPNARRFHLTWMALALEWAQERNIAVFDKQVGSYAVAGPSHRRFLTEDRKGGDMAEWPADLRIREFPTTAGASL
jgi:protein gp37